MTIAIPTWLLWVIGVPLALVVLILAIVGAYALAALKNFRFWF